jgi:hypothetical protein
MTQDDEIIARLSTKARKELQAVADASGESLEDMLGHALYWINVAGATPAQYAALINGNYRGTDCRSVSVEEAFAIMRRQQASH